MTPLAFDLGSSEIIIIVLIALVLFGGSRLAGLGKGAGRAIREFKEETSGIAPTEPTATPTGASKATPTVTSTTTSTTTPVAGEQVATGQGVTPQHDS